MDRVEEIFVAFCVLSSRDSVSIVSELADWAFPHLVIVHHDFTKFPEWSVDKCNVVAIDCPVVTGWGGWSLVEAEILLIREALKDTRVTHIQFLSESCFPVRSVEEFVGYLSVARPYAMVDMCRLSEKGALRSHGWRYIFLSEWSKGVFRRIAFRAYPRVGFQEGFGVNFWVSGRYRFSSIVKPVVDFLFSACLAFLEWRYSTVSPVRFAVGSQWMALSRECGVDLLRVIDECPKLVQHFKGSHIPDEAFFQSVLCGVRESRPDARFEPTNHYLKWDDCGSGPDLLGESDIGPVKCSGKYFARKFPLDPAGRLRALVFFVGRDKRL